jgi:hypothetical protein
MIVSMFSSVIVASIRFVFFPTEKANLAVFSNVELRPKKRRTTYSTTTLSITTFCIMTLSMKGLFVTVSIMALDIKCCYAECRNAEGHG